MRLRVLRVLQNEYIGRRREIDMVVARQASLCLLIPVPTFSFFVSVHLVRVCYALSGWTALIEHLIKVE